MTALQRAPLANSTPVVDEFFTEAKVEALNAELTRREVSAEQVIAVLPVAGQIVAAPTAPQFRVLYRTR